jgi:tyrosyl-tRNA synthetase
VNTDDALVETYLKQFTFLPNDVIADLTSVRGEALREAKRVLALEATALAHGLDAARQAEEASKALFGGGVAATADDASLPTVTIPAGDVTDGFTIADAFVAAGLAKGRGEARRLADQGGLRAGEEKIDDVDQPFATLLDGDNAVILRAGKKRFQRVVVD